jgi:hypothetical protein
MDDNNKYNVQDLVISALEQKPDEFAQGFDSILVDKLNAAISNRKYELSQSIFSDPNEEEYEEGEGLDAEQETDLNPEE